MTGGSGAVSARSVSFRLYRVSVSFVVTSGGVVPGVSRVSTFVRS